MLQKVVALSPEELEATLEEAAERSIIEQRQRPGSIGFRFTHAFFRQVLYEEIFTPRRIRWHQQVARSSEEVYANRLEEHAAELVEHYVQSVDPEDLTKAVSYGELAGERAVSVFAHGEAIRHFEQALHAQDVLDASNSARRCDLLLKLGASVLSLADYSRILDEIAPTALSLAEELGDDRRAFAACELALNSTIGVLTPVGQHWNEIAERYVGDDLLAKIRMSRRKAAALSQDANLTAAAAVLKEGLALARQLGDADQEFGVASWLTLGNTDLAEMLSVANEYLGRARDSVGTLNLSRMLQFMAHVYLANGERQQAEVLVKELTDLASRSRNAVAQNQLDWITETFAMFDGNLDDLSQGMIEGAGFGYLASIAADYLGRPQPPDVRLAVGISLAAQVATARSKALKGDLAAAREDLRALVKELDVTKRELRPLMSSELLETAQLIEDDVALSHVFELCGKSLDPALILADSISPRPVFRIAGDAAQRLGYLEEARGLYEENRRLCERVGHRPELALTRAHLAELLLDHYPDERDAAIEHLDFAIAEFRDMKMQPALERALGRRGLLKA